MSTIARFSPRCKKRPLCPALSRSPPGKGIISPPYRLFCSTSQPLKNTLLEFKIDILTFCWNSLQSFWTARQSQSQISQESLTDAWGVEKIQRNQSNKQSREKKRAKNRTNKPSLLPACYSQATIWDSGTGESGTKQKPQGSKKLISGLIFLDMGTLYNSWLILKRAYPAD